MEERHDLKGFFEGFWSKPTTGARPGPRLATSLVQLRCNSLTNRRLLRGAAIVLNLFFPSRILVCKAVLGLAC